MKGTIYENRLPKGMQVKEGCEPLMEKLQVKEGGDWQGK